MTTITLPRAVIEQALEALDAYSWEQVDAARIALRAALAQHSPATLLDPRGSLGEPIV
jgi:predicted component of type VI protein secretion system